MFGLGLTTLGAVHTAIGLAALLAGFWALATAHRIAFGNGLGRFYVGATAATAATGLFIFNHGGFGPPHVLSLLTLLALGVGIAAARGGFGRWALHVETVAFTTTILFHLIPAFTETLIRVPVGKPLLPTTEAPELQAIYGVLFLLYGVGVFLQLRRIKAREAAIQAPLRKAA